MFRSLGSPQPHIKRALPAVRGVRDLKANDKRAKFRQGKPHRDLALENAALQAVLAFAGFRYSAGAFAGDDEHGLGAVRLRGAQKTRQRRVRLFLSEAMQVEALIDWLAPARHTLTQTPAERSQRRCSFFRGRFLLSVDLRSDGSNRRSFDTEGIRRFGDLRLFA